MGFLPGATALGRRSPDTARTFCLTSLSRLCLCLLAIVPDTQPASCGYKGHLNDDAMTAQSIHSFDLVVIFLGRTPPIHPPSFLDTPAVLFYSHFTIY